MKIISLLKKLRDGYVIRQVEHIKLPDFSTEGIVREHLLFIGRVQNVGFRMEVYLIAGKLGLTGWVKNKEDGNVEAEIQGEKSKIAFIKHYMKSLKRAKVTHIVEKELALQNQEQSFLYIE